MSLAGRAYWLAGASVLLGIIGQWWGGVFYDLWRLPTLILLCGLLGEWWLMRRQVVIIERHLETQLALGQETTGQISVHSSASRSLQLDIQPRYPAALQGAETMTRWQVGPLASAHQTFVVTPVVLGPTTLGPLYLRVLGRWGLAWWSRPALPGPACVAIPHRLHAREAGVGTAQAGSKQAARVASTGLELLSLRDYQPGDPLRAIDWKATARSRRPTVRVFAQEQHMALMLVVDAGRSSGLLSGSLTRLHHYVNVAARLAELAIRQGDQVGLVAFADRPLGSVSLGKGLDCLRIVRDQLQDLHSQPRESNPLAAVLFLRTLLKQRGLVVFLTEIEDKETATQLTQAVRLLVPKHSPLIASLVDAKIDAFQHQPPRHWLDPYLSYAALEYTQAVRNTVLHLRRLGANVVLEKPDRLDGAVLAHYRRLRERRRV